MTALSLTARLSALANPKRFLDISGVLLPWTAGAAALLLAAGLYMALFVSPPRLPTGRDG